MLTLTSLVKCQVTSNTLSEADFYNIKINNITLNDIVATYGNRAQIRNLIPAIIENADIDPDGEFYNYEGFNIGFSALIGETFEHPVMSSFEITNNTWSITIQGKTVTIGSNVSVLGNVVLNAQTNGGKSVVYQSCDGCNNFISLYLDSNKKIKRIVYVEQT